MKLFNIFKKETKSNVKSNVQKLEKNQLEKVIGGGDGTITYDSTEGAINTSRSNIRSPA
jgi:hypothetical protein